MKGKWMQALTCFAAVVVCVFFVSLASGQETDDGAKAEEGGGLVRVVKQAKQTADAMQAEAKAKRLEVLKRLEAGETTAEEALEELDALPASLSQYVAADGSDAWLLIAVKESGGHNELNMSVPMSVVRWVVSEGPKMLPQEIREGIQTKMRVPVGGDNLGIDISGILPVVEMLTNVQEELPLLSLKDGENAASIIVKPVGKVGLE